MYSTFESHNTHIQYYSDDCTFLLFHRSGTILTAIPTDQYEEQCMNIGEINTPEPMLETISLLSVIFAYKPQSYPCVTQVVSEPLKIQFCYVEIHGRARLHINYQIRRHTTVMP